MSAYARSGCRVGFRIKCDGLPFPLPILFRGDVPFLYIFMHMDIMYIFVHYFLIKCSGAVPFFDYMLYVRVQGTSKSGTLYIVWRRFCQHQVCLCFLQSDMFQEVQRETCNDYDWVCAGGAGNYNTLAAAVCRF